MQRLFSDRSHSFHEGEILGGYSFLFGITMVAIFVVMSLTIPSCRCYGGRLARLVSSENIPGYYICGGPAGVGLGVFAVSSCLKQLYRRKRLNEEQVKTLLQDIKEETERVKARFEEEVAAKTDKITQATSLIASISVD